MCSIKRGFRPPGCGCRIRGYPAIAGAAEAIRPRLIAEARALGFADIRFTPAHLAPEIGAGLDAFLASGAAGDMGWLAANPQIRSNPQTLWPEARTAIILAMNYGPAEDPLAITTQPDLGAISVYARNQDYHDLIKKRLKALGRWLHRESGAELKVFVDTAPLMEKPLAAASGLGWQGKHTNLVSREFGSWLFLGVILTTLDIQASEAMGSHCGQCRNCLDACPTAAFPAPYRLDASRCISYLTIEHKGVIAPEFRRAIGNRIYGCDDCLAVCPWNKFAQQTAELAFQPRASLTAPVLAELVQLDDAAFRQFFAGSPIKRIGRIRFIRNVLIALGNSGNREMAPIIRPLLHDAAALVRGMAVWALGRLDPAALSHGPADETDPDVLAEWQAISRTPPAP